MYDLPSDADERESGARDEAASESGTTISTNTASCGCSTKPEWKEYNSSEEFEIAQRYLDEVVREWNEKKGDEVAKAESVHSPTCSVATDEIETITARTLRTIRRTNEVMVAMKEQTDEEAFVEI